MKNLLFTLLITIPFVVLSQEKITIVSKLLNKTFIVSSNPKSIHDFSIKIPNGYLALREGRDNTTLQVFNTDINNNRVDLYISCLKWKDFPKYEKFLSMSNHDVNEHMNKIMKKRLSDFPNENLVFYMKDNLTWYIIVTYSQEKNIYVVSGTTYTNKQSTYFSFVSQFEGNQKEDIINLKNMINSFKFL